MEFKHSILLYKIFNTHLPSLDWVELNFNHAISSREKFFITLKSNSTKIGNNILSSRLTSINKKILLNDLNLSLDSFKVKYKQILMSSPWTND